MTRFGLEARWSACVALVGLCLGPGAPAAPAAQGVARAGETQSESSASAVVLVSGAVLVARGEATFPRPGVWVTLHRVGKDAAGAVDSVRTAPNGAFRIRSMGVADSGAVYFVSTVYSGIAYFSQAIDVNGAVAPAPVELTVYDTTSGAVPIDVASRHIIVGGAVGSGGREVTEVYILVNGGDRTRIAGDDGASFGVDLPAAASGVRMGEGDIAADGVKILPGRLQVVVPIAPGSKRFSVSYSLEPSGGALVFARDRPAALVEVLVGDSTATVSGAAVQEEAPVSLAGRTFRRFIANNVDAGRPLQVDVSAASDSALNVPRAFVVVAGLMMTIALIASLRRGASGDDPTTDDPTTDDPTTLAPVVRAE